MSVQLTNAEQALSDALRATASRIPEEGITIRSLLKLIGEQGLLLFCAFLAIPFLLPVSIPGVSTVFGLLIVLIGIGITFNRLPWLPPRLMDRHLKAEDLIPALERGATIIHRIDRVIRPRWLVLTHGATINRINGIALILAAVLLMAPLAIIPFSNTIPAFACLFLAVGMLQRDGLFIVLGYIFIAIAFIYFGVLVIAALAAGATLRTLLSG